MEKISAVYKIVNTVTGDLYIGSSKDTMRRWEQHKRPSTWKRCSNNLLYKDFQKYGVDKFRFQILAPVMSEYLTQVEQEFIEMLKPTYNNNRAKGRDIERWKEARNKALIKYRQSEKYRETLRKYNHSKNGKEAKRKCKHRLCFYNGETLTLDTLLHRFKRAGVEHPYSEAKKYLIK